MVSSRRARVFIVRAAAHPLFIFIVYSRNFSGSIVYSCIYMYTSYTRVYVCTGVIAGISGLFALARPLPFSDLGYFQLTLINRVDSSI